MSAGTGVAYPYQPGGDLFTRIDVASADLAPLPDVSVSSRVLALLRAGPPEARFTSHDIAKWLDVDSADGGHGITGFLSKARRAGLVVAVGKTPTHAIVYKVGDSNAKIRVMKARGKGSAPGRTVKGRKHDPIPRGAQAPAAKSLSDCVLDIAADLGELSERLAALAARASVAEGAVSLENATVDQLLDALREKTKR